jgi:hypothetical protein
MRTILSDNKEYPLLDNGPINTLLTKEAVFSMGRLETICVVQNRIKSESELREYNGVVEEFI